MGEKVAGTRIGPYELLARLGAGGMGEVWKARDTRLDRTVAIKFAGAAFGDRVKREAQTIAALSHPNIATLFDVGADYLVMEYVEGEPLRPTADIRKLLDIATQIADGLAAAHASGILHRDLKPDNILVTTACRVKILDFGLAKQHAIAADATQVLTITQPGMVVGTVAYMSPEQARGQALDARSDQFSFGLILYEMATGRRPFRAESTAELMTAIIREEAAPLPSTLPAPLRWTIERLLSKNPQDRYASTADLFAELRTIRARLPELSSSVGVTTATPRRRFPAWAAAALLVLFAFAALAFRAAFAPDQPDFSRYRFTPFAISGDDEDEPVWSPDGRSIAYLSRSGASRRLMVKNLDASPAVTLVKGNVSHQSWSGDGERIYYERSTRAVSSIYSVSRGGGAPTVLFGADATFRAPAASPDGKFLAMLREEQVNAKQVRRIWLSSPPGAPPTAIGPELPCCITTTRMSWSPDSSKLIASVPDDIRAERLWLVPLHGKWKRFLPSLLPMSPQFAWMPDNRNLVLTSFSPKETGLYLLNTESEAISMILPRSGTVVAPAVSPDGKRIAYVDGSAGIALSEISLDGRPPVPLLASNVDQHSVAWSPVRDELVFVRAGELLVRSRSEGNERVIASTRDFPAALSSGRATDFYWPEFSPDGKRVAYSCAGCEVSISMWISPVTGGSPARLTSRDQSGFGTSWSPDAEWIAFISRSGGMKVRPGSVEPAVPLPPACDGFVAWSPKGDRILCDGSSGIHLVSPDGKTLRTIEGRLWAAGWSHDGRSIYAIRREPPPNRLYTVDPDSGRWQAIADVPPSLVPTPIIGSVARLSVALDGKSVATSSYVHDGDIWILDGYQPPRTFFQRLWPWGR